MRKGDAIEEYEDNIRKFNVVLSKIDNATDYFIISGIEYCGELEALSPDDVETGSNICPNIVKGSINTELDEYAALQQPDGGISINKYMNDNPNVEFFINLNENMIKLIQNAIVPMNKLGVYHFDIKPDNILLGDDAKCRLHRPERKMRQNTVMSCIFYNYVSSSLLDELLLFSYPLYL